MVKRIGTDWGLNVRMVLTMFLLACLYLAFMGALYYFGVNAFLIVFIAGILLIAQYYFSDKLILLSLGVRYGLGFDAPWYLLELAAGAPGDRLPLLLAWGGNEPGVARGRHDTIATRRAPWSRTRPDPFGAPMSQNLGDVGMGCLLRTLAVSESEVASGSCDHCSTEPEATSTSHGGA